MALVSCSNRSENCAAKTLIATTRFKRASVARYTRPMPPAPISASTTYGPSCCPGVRSMPVESCGLSDCHAGRSNGPSFDSPWTSRFPRRAESRDRPVVTGPPGRRRRSPARRDTAPLSVANARGSLGLRDVNEVVSHGSNGRTPSPATVEWTRNGLRLDEALAPIDLRKAKVIELRFFGGLSVEEAAEVLKISAQSVMRDWQMARAWLMNEMAR
jgi:ECF sigma factor